MKHPVALFLAALALTVAACDGGGGGGLSSNAALVEIDGRERAYEELLELDSTPVACADGCPEGSHCDEATDRCAFECINHTDCGADGWLCDCKRTPGSLLQLSLGEGDHAYGLVLDETFVAFYDLRTGPAAPPPAEIVARPVLFVIAIHDRAFRGDRWPITGTVDLARHGVPIPPYFVQNVANPRDCKIIEIPWRERAARPEDCVGLERAAVWDAEHVEARLRDHFAGRPNPSVEHMKVKP